MTDSIPVLRLSDQAILPTRAHADDAGLDLYGIEDFELAPGGSHIAATGVALALPAGHVGLIADRSSMAKRGVKTAGGVIDAGYRGEIKIVFWNLSSAPVQVRKGERIAQLLILPVATPAVRETESVESTTRGDGGFGSTGR